MKLSKILAPVILITNITTVVMMICLFSIMSSTANYIEELKIPEFMQEVREYMHESDEKYLTQDMLDDWNAAHDENLSMDDVEISEPIVQEQPPIVEEIIPLELVADVMDVTKPSNATPEELNKAIEKTCKWMHEYNPNIGQVYHDLEEEYGINAYFALAVSFSEVGVQEMSKLAKNRNNTYGLNNDKVYDSVEDCTEYFFYLIDKYYVGQGLMTVEDISQKYCLGNPTWIKNVSIFMNTLPEKSR